MADDQDQPKSEPEKKPSSDFTFSFTGSDPDLAHLKESISPAGKKVAGNDDEKSQLDNPYVVNSFNDSQSESFEKIPPEENEVDPSRGEDNEKSIDENQEIEDETETVTKDRDKLSWNSHVNKSTIGYPSGPVPEPEDQSEEIGFNETEFKDYLVSVGLYEIFESILLRLYQTPIRPEADRVIEFILENLDSERQAEIKLRFNRTKEKLLDEIQRNEDLKKKNVELKKAVDEMISANYPNEPEQNLSWNEPEPAEDTSAETEAQKASNGENDDEVTTKGSIEENDEGTTKENDEVSTKESEENDEVSTKESEENDEVTTKENDEVSTKESEENDEVTTKESEENDQVGSAEPKIEDEGDEPAEEKEVPLQDDEELEHDAKDIISLLEHDLYDHEDEFKNED